MLRIILSIVICLSLTTALLAQKSQLAYQYYKDGEYEKAAQLYYDLYKEKGSVSYFKSYVTNLDLSGAQDEAIKALKDEIKRAPQEVSLPVSLGNLLESRGELEESQKYYQKAIENIPANESQIREIANEFVRSAKYDLAEAVYLRGLEVLKSEPNGSLHYYLGDVYRRQSDMPNMIHHYLESLKDQPYRARSLESTFQRELEKKDYAELQAALFDHIQTEDLDAYYELLIWSFIYTKNLDAALRQAIALDRRKSESGQRVLKIGETALDEEAHSTAISAFEYIIDIKGEMNPYYYTAKLGLMNGLSGKILSGDYTEEEILGLKSNYQKEIADIGRNRNSIGLIRNLAHLHSHYLNELDSAIFILEEARDIGGIQKTDLAELKLDLADYYLMKNNRWEASLLYSQVDKDFEEDPLGHEARFRNAKLAYFMGDFEWAQVQFDVLKSSTSKLISNNAIDMSVFIQDNLALDTSDVALSYFARSDLFAMQQQYDSAMIFLRKVKLEFPDHDLLDDVIYREANIYSEMKNYEKAIERYEYLIRNYPEDITADNGVYELAEIFESVVDQPDRAQELYETIFLEYESSTLAGEARKRYRKLRGDEVEL